MAFSFYNFNDIILNQFPELYQETIEAFNHLFPKTYRIFSTYHDFSIPSEQKPSLQMAEDTLFEEALTILENRGQSLRVIPDAELTYDHPMCLLAPSDSDHRGFWILLIDQAKINFFVNQSNNSVTYDDYLFRYIAHELWHLVTLEAPKTLEPPKDLESEGIFFTPEQEKAEVKAEIFCMILFLGPVPTFRGYLENHHNDISLCYNYLHGLGYSNIDYKDIMKSFLLPDLTTSGVNRPRYGFSIWHYFEFEADICAPPPALPIRQIFRFVSFPSSYTPREQSYLNDFNFMLDNQTSFRHTYYNNGYDYRLALFPSEHQSYRCYTYGKTIISNIHKNTIIKNIYCLGRRNQTKTTIN